MLSVVTEPYFTGKVSDVVLLPISINYEKFVEGEKHVGELLGENKKQPTLKKFLEATFGKVLGTSYGRINVQFADAIYLSQFVDKCKIEHSIMNPSENVDDKHQVVERLAYKIIHDFNKESICMSTAIISSIMLSNRHGITFNEVLDKYQWICKMIEERGFRVDYFRDKTNQEIVKRAIHLIGENVLTNKHGMIQIKLEKKEDLSNLGLLGIYRNQIPHVFFTESVMCCAVFSLQSQSVGEEKDSPVSLSSLLERSEFLANLMRVDFHVSEEPKNKIDFNSVLKVLISRNILKENHDNSISLCSNSEETFYWMCSLLWPFIDGYWVASVSLYSLLNGESIEENRLLDRMLWLTEKLFHDNVLLHYDACSKEVMRCAVTVFVEDGLLSRKSNSSLCLSEPFLQNEKKVSTFSNFVSSFRKTPLSSEKNYTRKGLVSHFPSLLSRI